MKIHAYFSSPYIPPWCGQEQPYLYQERVPTKLDNTQIQNTFLTRTREVPVAGSWLAGCSAESLQENPGQYFNQATTTSISLSNYFINNSTIWHYIVRTDASERLASKQILDSLAKPMSVIFSTVLFFQGTTWKQCTWQGTEIIASLQAATADPSGRAV
jgi:hypothetical protein